MQFNHRLIIRIKF